MDNNAKKCLLMTAVSALSIMVGCSAKPQKTQDKIIDESEIYIEEDVGRTETENIAVVYCNIYEEAVRTDTAYSLEMIGNIVNRLGEYGFTAVDSDNQIDMTEPDCVPQFCEKAETGDKAELTIIVVPYSGAFIKYDFSTQDGNVDIVREYYQYVDDHMECKSTGNFRADVWEYTEDGYLLFEGNWFSEESYVLTLSDVPERAALRVEPLDEKCRELNREYMLPVGYGRNNMFLTDWNEDDYGELNFYDLYDIFYPLVYGQAVPYTVDEDLGVGAVYRIPKEEFESVVMTYINIDSETLQSKTAFFPEDEEYEYKPRGFYETEYPELPYPEVVNYTENPDGTITLTVNVIYPNEIVSKVYSHEVMVRPLKDGGFQYVSNHIVPSDENYEQTWHVPRLTEEEWEERYGGHI